MNELYPSGSTLILFFSGVSGSAFLSNNYDHYMPISIKGNKGFIYIDRPIKKSELLDNYMLLNNNENCLTKYRLIC